MASVMVWVLLSAWRASRRGVCEEKAHATAWSRRTPKQGSGGANREASMMILGDFESRIGCRVTRVSRSCLRAFSTRSVGEGSQVRVDWGDDVFIGNVRAEQEGSSGFSIEVDLQSSTYRRASLLTRMSRGFQL
jgi:hypothetical protein